MNNGTLNNSKQKLNTNNGANFLQKRLNQLPNLFHHNIPERDDEPCMFTNSSSTKKEKFRIKNFLSVSANAHESADGRVGRKKLTHQNLSLNSTLSNAKANSIQIIVGDQLHPKKNSKSTLKECINQKNVRRKSSTMNTSCVNFSNSYNKVSSLKRNQLNVNLIQKAARRGSIHFYDYDKTKKIYGEDAENFRQRLLKLQRQQLEFLKANPQLSSNGAHRRKRAFVINEDSENDELDDSSVEILPKLTHAISSLVSLQFYLVKKIFWQLTKL